MFKFNKIIILLMKLTIVISANGTIEEKSITFILDGFDQDIVKEFKDFGSLIPTVTLDAIVAKHYVIDGSFRTAVYYFRSDNFNQLQRELLNMPEIIEILKFLHLMTKNAATSHMGATNTTMAKATVSLNDDNDDDANAADVDNGVEMTTTTAPIISKRNTMAMENVKESLNKRTQQLQMANNRILAIDDNNDDDDDDDDIEARTTNKEQPLVSIVLLDDLKVKRKVLNESRHHNQRYYLQQKYQRHQRSNNNSSSVGTLTTFVDEVLQHLPHPAFQKMITDKCKKNAKFAKFYKALRSPDFKKLIDRNMQSDNIKKVIKTLNSNAVDVKALEPIAFKVISWGPDI